MPPEPQGPVAAIDCGTNSTRLLIRGVDGATLERHMRVTRLGEGVDATHELSGAAIDRTLEVLGDYRRLMDVHRVVRARLVTTSATRDRDQCRRVLLGRATHGRSQPRAAER